MLWRFSLILKPQLNLLYVLTAQQYSETIRTMVAAITSLQAANKIPEAAQRLIDALAR